MKVLFFDTAKEKENIRDKIGEEEFNPHFTEKSQRKVFYATSLSEIKT